MRIKTSENTDIPSNLMRKLAREASGADSPDFLEVLKSEAVARRWFLSRELPCWRTPQKPSEKSRYSLLFSSGRRAIAVPAGRNRVSFDTMAEAKCDYLLTVKMDNDFSGTVQGYFYLSDIRKPGNIEWRPDLEVLDLREMKTFPELLNRPRHFRLSYILGSLRLLIMNDRKVPPPAESRPPSEGRDS